MKQQTKRPSSAYKLLGFALGIALLVCVVVPLHAQYTTARLDGTVVGPTGGALVSAHITVRNTATGYTRTVTTDSSGGYLFTSLPVGVYDLMVTESGFNAFTQKGITLSIGQTVTVPVRMTIGSVTQRVTVVANSSLVTTDSPTLSQVISQKAIVSLPLNGRMVQQLVFLVPGTSNQTATFCSTSCEGGTFPGEQYAVVNGGGSMGTAYLLDGADFTDPYLNTNLPFPNPDAIQEFNVTTGDMSAAFGNAIGGVVNVVTKSGTNQIHGDIFDFLRNTDLNAANYFTRTRNILIQNQFGGSAGGPILRNRLFYFGSYEGLRFRGTAAQNQVVPTAAERGGDFSALLPQTQLVNPVTGAPFPGNIIPKGDLNPVAQYFLARTPLPNGPGGEFIANGVLQLQTANQYLGKVDLNEGKHHISGRYFEQHYSVPNTESSDILLVSGGQREIDRNVSVIDSYAISPKFLLNSSFDYNQLVGENLSAAPFNMADAGAKIAQPPNKGGGNTADWNINVSTFGYGSGTFGSFNRSDFSIQENATWVRGNNELQFGGEFTRVHNPVSNLYHEGGVFNFTNALTGNNFADFIFGQVSSFTQAAGEFINYSGIRPALFVQDNWKATPRLTLDGGLRWDPYVPYKDSLGRVECFVPGAHSLRYPTAPVGLIFGGNHPDPGCTHGVGTFTPGDFAPRAGFAYRLTADGRTSIRGGAGYYYVPIETLILQREGATAPFAPQVVLTDVNFTDPYGSAGVKNPYPAGFGPINPTADEAIFPADESLKVIDSNVRLPMTLAYNLTFERGLGKNWLVRVAYVGNVAHHLYGIGDQEAGMLELNAAKYIPGESTEGNTQERRPYPNFSEVRSVNFGVNSNYNAGQLTLEKRFNRGLSLLSSFVWQANLDDFAPNEHTNPTGVATCTCGRYFDYGPTDYDITKAFKLSADYMTPHVQLAKPVNWLLNGWEGTVISNWHGGLPFSVYSGMDNSFSGIDDDRADLTVSSVKKAILPGRSHAASVAEWFNTSAFTTNAVGTFGDTGKNILRGPRYFDADIAAIRNFSLTERVKAQFRAEFFNAFNNVNFARPDSTVTDGPGAFGVIFGLAGSDSWNSGTYGTAQPRIIQFAMKLSF